VPQDQTRFIDDLLARMSLREKIGQLNYPHADGLLTTGAAPGADTKTLILRGELCGTSAGHDAAARRALQTLAIEHGPHGIPLFFAKDCIQRYVTGAPIPLAQSCSWEPELLRRIAAMTAAEARADGVNLNWAPMLDITHDARWGRVAEGHGELPYLCARLAEAVVRGYQGEDGYLGSPGRMMATLGGCASRWRQRSRIGQGWRAGCARSLTGLQRPSAPTSSFDSARSHWSRSSASTKGSRCCAPRSRPSLDIDLPRSGSSHMGSIPATRPSYWSSANAGSTPVHSTQRSRRKWWTLSSCTRRWRPKSPSGCSRGSNPSSPRQTAVA
jgi:hypothetical protein